jgi:hypothetical protein
MNIVYLMIAVLLLMSGIALKFQKAYWIISGYDTPPSSEENKEERDKLCRSAGNFAFLLSAIVFAMVAGAFFRQEIRVTMEAAGWTVFAFSIVIRVLVHGKKSFLPHGRH